VVVLEEKRAIFTHTLSLVGVGHGNAIGGGVKSVLSFGVPVVNVVAVDVAVALAIGSVLRGINCSGCHVD
jgi:mono/diheme cytochrome c family protein